MEDQDFHEKVRQAYLKVAKTDQKKHGQKARWQIIDASPDLETVEADLWERVEHFLEKKALKAWQNDLDDVDLEYSE